MTVREQIQQTERAVLAPWATLSEESQGRSRQEPLCPLRTCFQRDRDRIIHCKAFRRLKQKTQVFLSPQGDHYHTRLAHTLQVSQVARTIARALRLNEDLTEAIALGHDLGHTPFGHAGERALNRLNPCGFRHYEQSVRVLQQLEKDGQGLNLCKEVLEGIEHHTAGAWPESPEGCVVRYADRIAYMNHDIEDAVNAGVLCAQLLPAEVVRVLGQTKSERITTLVTSVIENSTDQLQMSAEVQSAYDELYSFLHQRVYAHERIRCEEAKVERLIEGLYGYFRDNPMQMPQNYLYVLYDEGLERAVTDFISGMTDSYAVHLYSQLFVPRQWDIF